MNRCRCQNRLVADAVMRGATIVARYRLEDPDDRTEARVLVVDFKNGLLQKLDQWPATKPFLEIIPFGGEWFRSKNLEEKKNVWDGGFDAGASAGRDRVFLFIGGKSVNRFTGYEQQESANRADFWHWSNLCDAADELKILAANDPAPEWPPHSTPKRSPAYGDAMHAIAKWHARRMNFFREKLHPKILGSLGCLADAHGQTPSFVVVGGRSDLDEYVRQQGKKLLHHNRKKPAQDELQSDILKGEWAGVVARLKRFFREDTTACVKAIQRAELRGKISTSASREWFKKFNAVSLFGSWARRSEKVQAVTTLTN